MTETAMHDKPHTILIIENDRALLAALRDTFIAKGFNVLVATSGEQGLETAKQEKPDLILLDLMLEQLTGIDVLKTIRKLEDSWSQKVKIIVLTGLTYIANMEEIKKLSTRFVPKSDFDMNSLSDLVQKLLA